MRGLTRWHRRGGALFSMALVAAVAAAMSPEARAAPGDWPMFNHDPRGSRSNQYENDLTPARVRALHVAWRFRAPAVVYSTPAVVGTSVYADDILGDVFALDAATGRRLWLTHIPALALPFPLQVTDSPLVTEHDVVVGDQAGGVHAFDRATGALRWSSHPNPHAYAAVWGSAEEITARMPDGARRRLVIVPFSSNEETFTPTTFQPCCSARGSVAALDPGTGRLVWQAYTISPADAARGAAGATVWASPSFDKALNQVLITTGNNFGNSDTSPTTQTSDSFIAVDAGTGAIRWTSQRTANDTFTTAFRPQGKHPDFDFGDSPNVMRLPGGRKVVIAGQKSGVLYAVDARSGGLVSLKQFLPSGGYGGIFADSANAAGMVFANGNDWPNFGGGEFGAVAGALTPGAQPISGQVIAVRPERHGTLHEVWRFVRPHSPAMAPLAVAAGVLYVNVGHEGRLFALDARTGAQLASVDVGPSVSGPAVSHGRVYMGFGDTVNIGSENPLLGGVLALAP